MPDIDVGRKKVVAFLEANNIKKTIWLLYMGGTARK